MRTVVLDEEQFARAFVAPMRDVTGNADAVVDVWPYVLAIPSADLWPLAFREGVVEHVYRSRDARFDHVLVPTSAANVYIVVVVARSEKSIHGHHILDLSEKYGLKSPPTIEARRLARAICSKHDVIPEPPELGARLGIALDTLGRDPLNGLRSNPVGETCGWYVWGGDVLSDDPDFFQPLHVSHLSEQCPSVLPYLALPPGWRFLVGSNDHVDVWYDEQLLAH
jgi:hypothetical protein